MSDFLIIGAGINGLLLTRELSGSGAEVCLIDRSRTGSESSWAGGGIVSPLYPWRYPPPITALASWAQDFYPELVAALLDETGIDAEFNQSGLLVLSKGMAAEENAEALQWAEDNGRNMFVVDKKAIYQSEPALAPGFESGIRMQDVANVRNPRLCQALTTSLRHRENVTILEECQVTDLILRNGSRDQIDAVEITSSDGITPRRLNAKQVIVCAGAWSACLLSRLAIDVEVEPVKGQMLLYKFDRPPIQSILLTEGRYLIPRLDGHVLAGSTLEHEGFDKRTTEEARNSLHESACTLLPELESKSPVNHWAGLRPGAPGGLPYIGKLTGFNNLYINAGQYRNGLVLAPASARLLADLLLDREPVVDPTPYDPRQRATQKSGAIA